MDYKRAIDYVDSFIDFEKIPRYSYTSSFKLDRMHALLQELGNPHRELDIIHIAGSKGKGSACSILAGILSQAGYSVGLYTSPHLMDARERIRILTRGSCFVLRDLKDFEGTIKEGEFVRLIERIRPAAEKFRDHKKFGKLSFFEIFTACAFLYFKERKVDIVILETGLGGRLDATNAARSLLCGITNISLEHTDKLGNSLESIAREKAGIIKAEGVVVSAPQKQEAINIIRPACREKDSRLYEVGRDINYSIINSSENAQEFNLDGLDYSYKNLRLSLIGRHQVENASLAIAMAKLLDKGRFNINEESIRAGLERASWPGRLQVVMEEPYVILDGAQNAASIKAVLSSIKEVFRYKRLICVFGICSDKDIKGVAKELDRTCDIVILTKSKSTRAEKPLFLKENFCRAGIEMSNGVEDALKKSLKAANREDLILVTGSLYIVGEALTFLKENKLTLKTMTEV